MLYEAKKAKRLVDEANEITQAIRPQDNLRFELNAIAPMLAMGYAPNFIPEMLVRVIRILTPAQKRWKGLRGYVLKHIGTHEGSEQDHEVLFVWTLNKFVSRLDMMRDIYHTWMQVSFLFFYHTREYMMRDTFITPGW